MIDLPPGTGEIIGIVTTIAGSVGGVVWKAVKHYNKKWEDMERSTAIALKAFDVNKNCQALCLKNCAAKMGVQGNRLNMLESRMDKYATKLNDHIIHSENYYPPQGGSITDTTKTGKIQKIVQQQLDEKMHSETQKLEWEKINDTSRDIEMQIKQLTEGR